MAFDRPRYYNIKINYIIFKPPSKASRSIHVTSNAEKIHKHFLYHKVLCYLSSSVNFRYTEGSRYRSWTNCKPMKPPHVQQRNNSVAERRTAHAAVTNEMRTKRGKPLVYNSRVSPRHKPRAPRRVSLLCPHVGRYWKY